MRRYGGWKGSQSPKYLEVTLKYKLDSKEGPSCSLFKLFSYALDLTQLYRVSVIHEL